MKKLILRNNVIIRTVLSGLLLVSGLALIPARHVKAAGPNPSSAPCSRQAAIEDSYNHSDHYNYRVVQFLLNNVNSASQLITNGSANGYLSSVDKRCALDWGGAMDQRGYTNTNYTDLVYFNKGPFRNLVSGANSSNPNARYVTPSKMYLGIKINGPHQTDPTSGHLCDASSALPDPALVPPLKNCNSESSAVHSRANFVDDAGRLVIGGIHGDRTIWCVGINKAPPVYSATGCNPDVTSTGTKSGAGYLYTLEQCVAARYSGCGAYASWYVGRGMYNNNDLSGEFGRDAVTGDFRGGYYNHMDSQNTKSGGFGVINYYTLRYSINGGQCKYTATPNGSNIDYVASFKNTGTRFWRQSDGFLIRVWDNNANNAYATYNLGAVWVAPGRTYIKSLSLPATGNYSIQLMQDRYGTNGTGPSISDVNDRTNQGFDVFINNCTNNTSVPPTCSVIFSLSGSQEVGTTTGVSVNIVNNTGVTIRNATSTLSLIINGPAGFSVSPTLTFADIPNGSSGNSSSYSLLLSQVGQYNVTANLSGAAHTSCTGQVIAVYKPYIRAYGGDVVAGMDSTCNNYAYFNHALGETDVVGFTNGSKGSGGELGVFAIGSAANARIGGVGNPGFGFLSAGLRSASAPVLPSGLDFANSVTPHGQFANPGMCPGNFVVDIVNGCTLAGTCSNSITNVTTGDFIYSDVHHIQPFAAGGSLCHTLGGTINIPLGVHMRVWVATGSVGMGCNIKFRPGPYSNPSQIPSFTLVSIDLAGANRHIEVKPEVTRLDGTYVAYDYFNDCSVAGIGYTSPAGAAACNKQLTINGAVVAGQIFFLRTSGTLNDGGGVAEYPGSGNRSCSYGSNTDTPSSCAAEVINFSPASYLMPGPIRGGFDSITSLPPVL